MDECAACGAAVDGVATYCDACRTDGGEGPTAASSPTDTGATVTAPSPLRRAVGAFLVLATVLGGVTTLRSLQYVPQALSLYGSLDTVGFLLNQAITVGLLLAYAVMAKGLFDGTADTDRYGRILQVLAVASVVLGVVVTAVPNSLTRWLPTLVDPGYVVLNVTVFLTNRTLYAQEWRVLAVGVLGAAITFTAGTGLRRD